jgi:hypothetical protein
MEAVVFRELWIVSQQGLVGKYNVLLLLVAKLLGVTLLL